MLGFLPISAAPFSSFADSLVISSNAATTITFSGASAGYLTVASTPFTVGANGSISGVLVVTLNLEVPNAAFGTLSQTVFSLSSGASTGTFTYTPTAIGDGSHHIIATNNQTFASVSSIYAVSLAPIILPPDILGGGGSGGRGGSRSSGGHKKEYRATSEYHTVNEEFWEVRERYLRRHLDPTLARVHIPDELQSKPFANADVEDTATALRVEMSQLLTKRKIAHASAMFARSSEELQAQTSETLRLTLDIEQLINEYYLQAALILLLDI